jgi:hypothetical protein
MTLLLLPDFLLSPSGVFERQLNIDNLPSQLAVHPVFESEVAVDQGLGLLEIPTMDFSSFRRG